MASILAVISGKLDVACVQLEILNSVYLKDKNVTSDKFDMIVISRLIPQVVSLYKKGFKS